jgi:hypothetical protein
MEIAFVGETKFIIRNFPKKIKSSGRDHSTTSAPARHSMKWQIYLDGALR